MSARVVAPQASGSDGDSGRFARGGGGGGGGRNGNGSWGPKVASELLAGDSVSGEPAGSGSGHLTGAGAEESGESAGGAFPSQRQQQQQQQQQEGGRFSRVKSMQDRAGQTQVETIVRESRLDGCKTLVHLSDTLVVTFSLVEDA